MDQHKEGKHRGERQRSHRARHGRDDPRQKCGRNVKETVGILSDNIGKTFGVHKVQGLVCPGDGLEDKARQIPDQIFIIVDELGKHEKEHSRDHGKDQKVREQQREHALRDRRYVAEAVHPAEHVALAKLHEGVAEIGKHQGDRHGAQDRQEVRKRRPYRLEAHAKGHHEDHSGDPQRGVNGNRHIFLVVELFQHRRLQYVVSIFIIVQTDEEIKRSPKKTFPRRKKAEEVACSPLAKGGRVWYDGGRKRKGRR